MKWNVIVDGAVRQYEKYNPDDDDGDEICDGDVITEFPSCPNGIYIQRDITMVSQVKWKKPDSCLVIKVDSWGGPLTIATLLDELYGRAANPLYWKLVNTGIKLKKRLPLNANFSKPLPLP
mgnify:CR=1 FL=1